MLADALETQQSNHKGKERKLKDAHLEIEAESTNNENQLLSKAILLEAQVFSSGSKFKEVMNKYRRYVSSKYKIWPIIFDGYKSNTTKDHEHARREVYNPPCADVLVDKNVNVLLS